MKAAVYHAPGDIRIEEREPRAPGPGEVLVEMRACGVCGSDLMDWYQGPRAPIVHRSYRNARNGASPVPGPTMMSGVSVPPGIAKCFC